MKYVLAGLAVVAGIAALFFRPPQTGLTPVREAGAAAAEAGADRPVSKRGPIAGRPVARRIVVYVAGEVAKPGVYALTAGDRAQDALVRAGGPKADADLVAVNLAERLDDGQEVAVPKIGAELPRNRRRSAAPRARKSRVTRGHRQRRSSASDDTVPEPQSVDLNSADEAEFETLPGVGPALAARIVAYREANGPFASVDELADISGISPSLQDKLAEFVVVR